MYTLDPTVPCSCWGRKTEGRKGGLCGIPSTSFCALVQPDSVDCGLDYRQRTNYDVPRIAYIQRPGQPSERQIRLRLRNRWKALSPPQAAASLALVPIREAAKRPEATKFIAPLCRDCRNVLPPSSQHNNNKPFDCGPSTTISCFFRSSRPFFRKNPLQETQKNLKTP